MYFCAFCSHVKEITAFFFFLMIRRPPRSTLDRSSAASDVYKRQVFIGPPASAIAAMGSKSAAKSLMEKASVPLVPGSVSYTHLRAHETVLDLVCRLLLEKKKYQLSDSYFHRNDTAEAVSLSVMQR